MGNGIIATYMCTVSHATLLNYSLLKESQIIRNGETSTICNTFKIALTVYSIKML